MSRWRRLMPRTLAGKFLLFQLGVVGLVLMVAGVVSVRQSTSQFASSSGDRVLGAAENVAGNPLVKDGVVRHSTRRPCWRRRPRRPASSPARRWSW